jgi:hypothetical protein
MVKNIIKILTLILFSMFFHKGYSQQHYSFKTPYLEMVSVTDITTTAARINYKYSGNGCAISEVYIEWSDGITQQYVNLVGLTYDVNKPLVENDLLCSNMVSSDDCYIYMRVTNCMGQASGFIFFSNNTANFPPSVITALPTSITTTSAILNGEVTEQGSSTVTGRGFYWGTTDNPTTQVSSGSGLGTYNHSLTGLSPTTTYFYKTYATNSFGTSYGSVTPFTTDMLTGVPVVSTVNVTNITQNSSVVGGNIISNGNSAITEAGICYSISSPPTIANNKVTTQSTQGNFYSTLPNLSSSTKYYARAYALNNNGVGYGDTISFTTLAEIGLATVITAIPINIGTSTVTLGGNVTSDGGSTVLSRGVCIGTSPNPTTGPGAGSGTGSFTINHTGLTPGTQYYARAYVVNSTGINYGVEYQFQTLIPSSVPVITTLEAFNITETTAIVGGNISYDGNSGVIEAGVCYSISNTPTIANSKVITGTTSGGFYVMLSGLSPSTTYYARAYGINDNGVGYGDTISFTTGASLSLPIVTISSLTSLESTYATGGGIVTDDGGSEVTRGLVWNKTGNPSLFSYVGVSADGSGEGSFSSTIGNLTPNTKYFVKAYATNSTGTSYSETQLEFTTKIEPPVYVNNGGAAESTGSTLTVTYPSELSTGTNKRLFLFVMSRGLQLVSNLPSGWSLMAASNTTNGSWSIFQKTVIGTESGNFTVDLATSGNLTYGIIACYEKVTNISYVNPTNVTDLTGYSISLSGIKQNQLFVSFNAFMGIFNYHSTNGIININTYTTTGTDARIIVASQQYPSTNFSLSFPLNYIGACYFRLEN